MSRKKKLIILIVLVVAFFPLLAFSDTGIDWAIQREQRLDADETTRNADAPKHLWWIANVLDKTWRVDKSQTVLHDWIRRYGGDDTEKEGGDKLLPWEGEYWSDSNKRPTYYNKEAHPLTAKVLIMYAEHFETKREYLNSKHLFDYVVKNFQNDPESVRRADAGIMRHKSRSF